MEGLGRRAHHAGMLRRTLAIALWAYFGWYLGSLVATFTGMPTAIGPATGVMVAAIALVDWRRPRLVRQQAAGDALKPSR
jgi:hypothetical protein